MVGSGISMLFIMFVKLGLNSKFSSATTASLLEFFRRILFFAQVIQYSIPTEVIVSISTIEALILLLA
jgi:hypothetical protein